MHMSQGIETIRKNETGLNTPRLATAAPSIPTPSPLKKASDRVVSYPFDTTELLKEMLARFEREGQCIEVSFRNLVSWIKVGERATHYIHPYPAKLLPHIAHFFLANNLLSRPGDTVLDPFGGTGTVALEAALAGRRAFYSDVNPLAQLIARVKTTPLNIEDIRGAFARIQRGFNLNSGEGVRLPSVVNINLWYTPEVAISLCRIRDAIELESNRELKDFFKIAFSATCRKVSNADPRLSVPVRSKKLDSAGRLHGGGGIWSVFEDQVASSMRRMHDLNLYIGQRIDFEHAQLVGHDARSLRLPSGTDQLSMEPLPSDSATLIITSPPYAGAQKYIRASSLSLGWLDLAGVAGLKPLEEATIGREHFRKANCSVLPPTGIPLADDLLRKTFAINPLRGVIAATYLNELNAAIREMARVMVPSGFLVLVIGNNVVCGLPFMTAQYVLAMCQAHGLLPRTILIDEIKSRGLMTKRNKTANIITRESVLVLQKSIRSHTEC